ncbi:hypothetical protein J6N69_03275 [bacterium]|nr:hypothetical protein [bacterium]
MTYKSIIQILLILAIISTICIGIIKPKMHKPVMVLNSQFSVEHDSINIDENNISVMVQDTEVKSDSSAVIENQGGINFVEPKIEDVQPVSFTNTQTGSQGIGFENQKTSGIDNIGIKNNNSGIKTVPSKTTNNSFKSTPTNIKAQPATTNKSVVTTQQAPKIDLNKIVNNNQKIINTPAQNNVISPKTTHTQAENSPISTTKPKPIQSHQTQPQHEIKPPIRVSSNTTQNSAPIAAKTETKPVVLTAAQEEIAWNKWRSNLNNQIMKDSKLPTMPNGIIFKYKFTVDKYGKISNVQTSSTTPGYTPYAIQFIAPVIRSYQGRAILNFPTGSNRTSTEVSGAWKISSSSKLSTPDDYHDIEKIRK